MSDNELLRECYDQLRLLFNPEVPLVKALRERLEQPEHYIPLTDAEIEAEIAAYRAAGGR